MVGLLLLMRVRRRVLLGQWPGGVRGSLGADPTTFRCCLVEHVRAVIVILDAGGVRAGVEVVSYGRVSVLSVGKGNPVALVRAWDVEVLRWP